MDFDFSEDQILLRESVRALCRKAQSLPALRRAEAAGKGYAPEIWNALGEAGFCGIFISGEDGGIALDQVGAAVLYEELGRGLACSPHFVSAYLAARLIGTCGDAALRRRWLPALASGTCIATIAIDEPGRSTTPSGIRAEARLHADQRVIDGIKHLVPFASDADLIIVIARDIEGCPAGFLLDPRGPGVTISPQPSLGNDGLCEIRMEAAPVQGSLAGGTFWSTWESVLDQGGMLQAAFAAGAAQAVQEMSVNYAKEREQFGKPIGAFQAIAHYLAEMATEVDAARSFAYYAAWQADTGIDNAQAANQAKLFNTAVLRKASAVSIQVHGGFGFTLEADPQLFFRRAKHLQLFNGDPATLEDRIAERMFGPLETP
ncbi:MAG: acyl-CoA/acyl-ACP dehydrogenase [Proteobacteria bacterium]|nr:acyl-CoA/acyl-ACP dehydrogenase [Pseudomonadota bacterium]HQR02773.1 acyl-CoA dehydrogenase family protein [Rhodocyclaceae bacterium]